ncbi:hypothetical protein YC2023_019592 [Brassica napus]
MRGICTRPRRKLRNTGIESLLMRRDQFGVYFYSLQLLNSKKVTTEEYNWTHWHQPTSQLYIGRKTYVGIAYIHETTQACELELRSILYVPPVSPVGKDDVVN